MNHLKKLKIGWSKWKKTKESNNPEGGKANNETYGNGVIYVEEDEDIPNLLDQESYSYSKDEDCESIDGI